MKRDELISTVKFLKAQLDAMTSERDQLRDHMEDEWVNRANQVLAEVLFPTVERLQGEIQAAEIVIGMLLDAETLPSWQREPLLADIAERYAER